MGELTAMRNPRRFATWVTLLVALTIFAGFARTYYLKALFDTPALATLTHLHGVVMTAWVALFVVQVGLISSRRVAVHRKLGVAGAGLAGLVLVVGTATAVAAANRALTMGPEPLAFLVVPLGDLAVFAGLVGFGLALRKRLDFHRRLMLMSCIGLLPPAVGRLPFMGSAGESPWIFFGIPDLFLVALAVYDTVKHRRLHPAFAWAVPLVIASHPLRLLLSGTEVWMKFAAWLTS